MAETLEVVESRKNGDRKTKMKKASKEGRHKSKRMDPSRALDMERRKEMEMTIAFPSSMTLAFSKK